MARSLFRDTIMLRGSTGLAPLAGAQARFYEPGTLTPIGYPLYPDSTSPTPLTLPYVTGPLGELEVWADLPHRARVIVGVTGYVQADETIDIEPDPAAVASDVDVAAAIAAHEAKPDPHEQYLLESEADLLYLPIDYVPPSEYLTESEAALLYTPIGTAYTKAESDTRFEQLSRKGQPSGYVPLDPGGMIPNQYLPPLAITDSYVVANEAEMLALPAQKGDVAIRADVGISYILGAEPATDVANWYAMGGAGAGGNTSIIRDQEWAVSTGNTVTLADTPTDIFTVTRNGVAQSQSLGHFVWAGQTLTFADAFAAGEYITAVYQIGTTSGGGGGGGISQADADLRYVNVNGDTITGILVTEDEIQSNGGLVLNSTTYLASPMNVMGDQTILPDANGRGRIGSVSNRFRWVYSQLGDFNALAVNGADLTDRLIKWQTNGADRWRLGVIDTQAEGTPDVGGDFKFQAIWNDGTANDVFTVDRDIGQITFPIGNATPTLLSSNANASVLRSVVTPNNIPNWYMDAAGGMNWGTGSTATDVRLWRSTTATLSLNAHFVPNANNVSDLGLTAGRWRKLWAVGADLTNPPTVGGTVQPKITVASSAPSSPATGDLWIW